MDTQKNDNISLNLIPADRRILEELYSRNLISAAAREYGLGLLYPSKNWELWISRLLLITGVSLILSGIIYFFAFNWTKITPGIKLASIQAAILGCLAAFCYYGFQRISGKILLLCASVLVGVFLAVFGQIYQTGADAYNLFMLWALLTLPWAVISEFAALWLIWLIISNTFLILYWTQAALPEHQTEMMIVSYLAVFNTFFLGLREYFAAKGLDWLQDRWTRVVLIVPILVYVLIPAVILITEPEYATRSIVLGALLSAVIHAGFYIIYRYKLPDMRGLAATVLSGCIISETAIFKVLHELFRHSDSLMFLLMGALTLVVFSLAIIHLRIIRETL